MGKVAFLAVDVTDELNFESPPSMDLSEKGALQVQEAQVAGSSSSISTSTLSQRRRNQAIESEITSIAKKPAASRSPPSPPSTSTSSQGSRGSQSNKFVRKKRTVKASDFPPRPPSFYERMWPGHVLPVWAQKPFFFRKGKQKSGKRVCFVHVGKAAGSSLGCSLGFQLHCKKEMLYPLGVLPVSTTNVIHNDVSDCDQQMDLYLYSLRDPLERIRSWYVYDKRKLGKLRHECNFTTLNDLAEIGLTGRSSDLCNGRARRALLGYEKFGKHAYFNYRFYRSQVPSNATIAVIRAEHLLDDWMSTERLLGSDHYVKQLPERNTNRRGYDEKHLTDESRRLVCEQLCDEIQVYKDLLFRAANLNVSDVEQSLGELRRSCPREADLPACPK